MKFEFSPYVAVGVRDYEKACNYYEKVLGMEFVKKLPLESHFKKGSMNFCVSKEQGSETLFEFQTDNFSEAKKSLEEKGCKVVQTYGEKSMLFSDPFGLFYHVFQE